MNDIYEGGSDLNKMTARKNVDKILQNARAPSAGSGYETHMVFYMFL